MNWIERWLDQRRVKALKKKVAKMKIKAEDAALVPLMPAVETISRRILLERIVVLEKAVEKIEAQKTGASNGK